MILVVGATGTNGREVAARLAAAGQRVRALVRDPAKAAGSLGPDVELAAGDLDEPASLAVALGGVERALLVAPVDRRTVRWTEAFAAAAKRAGAPHVVRFSGMGAGEPGSELLALHGEADALLRASGLPFTILRPNSFFQNLLWSAETIRGQGAFYLPVGDARQSMVDVRDIAAVAVAALTGPGHEGQTYDITGPEAISYSDAAASLSRVLGKPVRYVPVSPEAARESMEKAGMPAWNAAAVTELYAVFAAGRAAATTDAVRRLTGRPPIAFEQFARDHAGAFA